MNLLVHVMINMEHLTEEFKLPAYFWCRSMRKLNQSNSTALSKEKILPTSFFVLALGFLWPNQRQFSPLSQHKIIHLFCWLDPIYPLISYLTQPLLSNAFLNDTVCFILIYIIIWWSRNPGSQNVWSTKTQNIQ